MLANQTTEWLKIIAILVAVILIVGGVVAWNVMQWFECRGMEFSVIYCIKHVM